jgi:hypothetical protein
MKLLIFLALLTLLSSQTPAQAQIDSVQWPFPKALSLFCNLGGVYTFSTSGTSDTEVIPRPEWNTYPLWFVWNNVQKVDSNEWQLANPTATLDLFLDTLSHQIDTLIFNYGGGGGNIEEGLAYELKNLYYSDSTIGFRDNDINRHLISASYSYQFENSNEYQITTYCCTFELDLFGTGLIEAFGAPHQVNFGTVSLDSSCDTTIKIFNYSDSAISILSFALNDPDSGFALVDTNVYIIPAGSSKSITIRFAPSKLKSYSGGITITTDEEVSN